MPIFPRLQENNVRIGFVDDAQYLKLAAYSPELWFRAILEVAKTYGWRKREVTGMRVSQVDLSRRTLRLEPGTTKNGEAREVSMTPAVHTLLQACVSGKQPDDFVFTRSDGKPVLDFRGTWANACKAAGCAGLLVHDLRRTAARNLRRAGVAEGVIQKIGGWKTRSVFERYNIVTQSDIQDAMLKLGASEQKPEAATENGYSIGYSDAKTLQVAKTGSLN